MAIITVVDVETLKLQATISEPLGTKGKGDGAFVARRTRENIVFYFRYTTPEGKRDALKIGIYNRTGRGGGMSLSEAREKAGGLSKLLKDHKDLRLWLDEQNYLEAERLKRNRRERETATLRALLNGYVEYLGKQGKTRTAKDAANLFERRVLKHSPAIASMKASDIIPKDITRLISACLEAGAGREAGKLRTYMSAAFSAALRADNDATIPTCLHGFNLDGNPAIAVNPKPLREYDTARERVLTKDEFRTLWRHLQDVRGPVGAAIRCTILLGGQRGAQLMRLTTDEIDLDEGTLTILDTKGRRAKARKHILPLPPFAREEIVDLMEINRPLVFSTDGGKTPVNISTISHVVGRIAKSMKGKPFQWRDVRRTVETLLAGKGVSKDVRAQLQSHGIGGVQDKHYDKHLYLEEKLAAMEKIHRLLSDEAAAIIPLRAGTKAR